jgi:hypothetical protein
VSNWIRPEKIAAMKLRSHYLFLPLAMIASLAPIAAQAQQQAASDPAGTLSSALSAACRQDPEAFANFLTAENAAAYRSLPGVQRTGMMKRFVLLDDPGRPLLSTGANGRSIVRCEAPGVATEMRLGEPRVHDNLAFVPMEIPLPNEPARAITFGLVKESGNWKLLSVGLLMLDVPSMAKQWAQADLEAHEDDAIANLRTLATALDTYRRAYGKLPESLTPLGPAAKGAISPETAGLLDSELATGARDGYTFRYTIVPAAGNLPEEDAEKAAGYTLAATPDQYGDTGKRSFFLNSAGLLRGDDKQGKVATSLDPVINSGNSDSR